MEMLGLGALMGMLAVTTVMVIVQLGTQRLRGVNASLRSYR